MPKQTLKIPTVGRIVHYYAVTDYLKEISGVTDKKAPLAALVVEVEKDDDGEGDEDVINVQVFTSNRDCPTVLRCYVHHKSIVLKDINGNPGDDYWDWPEIK